MIDLTIKTLDSQNHKFRVPDNFTILELKEHIAEEVNVAVVQQRLIFCGRVLSNETNLADIGIHGKVMHLVQKLPRMSSTTTTSGSSSSTTTNTNSRSGQNGGPGFRGWHTHDPTVLFGAIGIPSELMHAGELPRLLSARNHGTANRVSLAIDMIRRANAILNRLENPRTNRRPAASDAEQFPEGAQQAEDIPGSVLPEPSVPDSSTPQAQTQSDSDSVNVTGYYEVDDTFRNTVVVTIDATHHMRMPPALMRHMHNHLQTNNVPSPSTTEQTVESEATVAPDISSVGATNQSSAEQTPGTLPSSATSEQTLRHNRHIAASSAINDLNNRLITDRRRLRELIDQLNKLNSRLQPFYVQYCQYINDDPQFESTEGENGSQRAQIVFNGVSEVMHYISHVYHAISDLRVAFNRPPPRSFQSRPCLLQGTILHTAHSVSTTSAAPPPPPPPPPPPSSQQPTSTQTTNTSQSIPSVRAFRLDFMNPEVVGNETSNVSTSASSIETNSNMTVDPNAESNNTTAEFTSDVPHGVELMFDLAPGTIRIDSVEAFVTPNASGSSQPTTVSQPSSGNDSSNNMSMPIDWMDQMIDVISSGVRRPIMSDQSLDWSSIPTTSTRTPRVTPRTTDSSSTTNTSPQGLSRGRWDSSPRVDPFLPCNSHHFESNLRPMVLARRNTQGTDRSTSSASNINTTADNSTPTSPNEARPFPIRRPGRPRTRYVPDSDAFLSGIHPILTWGRNHRNNTATTSASNNAPGAGQAGVLLADTLAGQIRVGMESVFDTLEREEIEVDIDGTREFNIQPPSTSTLVMESALSATANLVRQRNELLLTPIGDIPFFRNLESRSILVDFFMLIARNWTLHDLLNFNVNDLESSVVQNPASRISEELVSFIWNRVMRNQPNQPNNIDEAANRIYLEIASYINIFQCSVPTRDINVNATFLRCLTIHLSEIVGYCEQIREGASSTAIVPQLILFAESLLTLIVHCCNNRAVFRLTIGSVMQFLPLPTNLHRIIMEEVRANVDKYWDFLSTFRMLGYSALNYVVSYNPRDLEIGQTSRVGIVEEQSSNPTLPSSEVINEPLPEVVIGSQEWHHSVPSEWVPVISRDSQRQRRQGTQPPYSDAYLSGMPNKRRRIVTSSKPQGPLSQLISKNLEAAMGAAGVAINKDLTASVGADTAVQTAYTERIRTSGRSGLDTHPDFCPDRYPNATKFFYDHNHPN